MKDRIYMVLAFLGFVIICVIYTFNADGRNLSKVFSAGGFYTPKDIQNSQANSADIYEQMTGGRMKKCPSVELSMSRQNGISLAGIYREDNIENLYGNTYFFVTYDALGYEHGYANLSNEWYDELGLSLQHCATSDTRSLSNLTNNKISTDVVELLAPFRFTFGNNNTDVKTDGNGESTGVEDIVIYNSAGNIKMVFGNVTNWFCAGLPGTLNVQGAGGDNNVVEWESHKGHHNSIIGNSKNSVVSSGNAGQVIGYVTGDTTLTIYKLVNNEWVITSLRSWLEG